MLTLALAEIREMQQIVKLDVLLVAWQVVLKLLSDVDEVLDLRLTSSEGSCLVENDGCDAVNTLKDVTTFDKNTKRSGDSSTNHHCSWGGQTQRARARNN